MERGSTRGLVESGLLVALGIVLFLASHFLPVAGVAVALICPVPLVVLGLRHTLKRALLGAVVAAVVVTIILGPLGGLFFALGFAATGVALGFFARRRNDAVEILLCTLLLSLGAKLVLMILATKLTGINPFSINPEELRRMSESVFSIMGQVSPETIQVMQGQMESVFRLIPLLFPGLLVIASAVDSLLTYLISAAVLRRLRRETLPALLPFEEWRFPKSLFWTFLFAVLLILWGTSQEAGLALKIGLNLRILVSMLFFLQGGAVILHFLRPFLGKGRWVVFGIFLLFPLLSQITLVLGLTDIWFDFRSRMRR